MTEAIETAAPKKLYSFEDHPEHEAMLPAWREKWILNALNCATMDDHDRTMMVGAVRGMYAAAKLEQPQQIIFAKGPVTAAIACGIAAGVWHLREHPEEQLKELDAVVTDAELLAGVSVAAEFIMRRALQGETEERIVEIVKNTVDVALQSARDLESPLVDPTASAPAADSKLVKFLIQSTSRWYTYYQGGNTWSGWVAYLSFFRHIAKLDLPEYEAWQHWENGAIHAGWRFMHNKFVIVCDRPEFIHRDERNRPHKIGGPFCRWRDGWEEFYVTGIRVTRAVSNGEFTAKAVLDEGNVELRRVMIDIYNQKASWLKDIGATELHADADQFGRPRRLLRVDVADDEPYVAVELINSTPEPVEEEGKHAELWRGPWLDEDGQLHTERAFKIYRLRVDPELRPLPESGSPTEGGQPLTCHNAVASTFGMRGEQYNVSIET